ncbi:SDR family oxidoreductase [Shimazuella alba]|uniref:SDR family oxidoreductase n=1 Tax=Shimazuella alba TaxID=2690964 RepID=A0A6I4VML3_9BACL|nr:SDR family oxidoreductase [Shimazuella alba]
MFLEKQSGVIVNIASAGELYGARQVQLIQHPNMLAVGLTKNTAFMYAQQGIRCNASAWGGVETNIMSSMSNINKFGISLQQLGMAINPRTGKPEEIAKVALILGSMIPVLLMVRLLRLTLVGLLIKKLVFVRTSFWKDDLVGILNESIKK